MKLDNVQQGIVNSNAKNIIVSAGAGSGKTRVLTERVKHLLETGSLQIASYASPSLTRQQMR